MAAYTCDASASKRARKEENNYCNASGSKRQKSHVQSNISGVKLHDMSSLTSSF